ncbi:MAG: hypothetical protein ABSB15_02105 [Bryobacteraceae bacterium]|jgi:hypothetical protein
MKNTSRPALAAPAEFIRMKLDAGFAAVQTGKMRSQSGASDAANDTRDYVEKTVALVRDALRSADLTETQLAVVNKKIQALRDAAGRIDSP